MRLRPQPLSQENFARFGDVIETEGRTSLPINQGLCQRFDDLSRIEVADGAGAPAISIFRSAPVALPLDLKLLERHPLASQAFIPLTARPFLVVVALEPAPEAVRAFLTNGRQGVNYYAGTWHHPLLVLDRTSDFVVIDRVGPGDNLDLVSFDDGALILAAPAANC